MSLKYHSVKSNARRAVRKEGLDPDTMTLLTDANGHFAYVVQLPKFLPGVAETPALFTPPDSSADPDNSVFAKSETTSVDKPETQAPATKLEEYRELSGQQRTEIGAEPVRITNVGTGVLTMVNQDGTRIDATPGASVVLLLKDAVEAGLQAQEAPRAGRALGFKIEKNREERNEVIKPSIGGVCRAIWDACQVELDAGTHPSLSWIKGHGLPKGWDKTTISVQYYLWRRFNGIRGRVVTVK